MSKLNLIFILFFLAASTSFGQLRTPVEIKKVFGGYHYYQGDSKLNLNQLVVAMESNAQAYQQIKKAQSTNNLGMLIAGAGGFMVGWPLGTAIAGGDPNWVLAGIGAGLIVVSIPIGKKVNEQAKQAVDSYNSGLQTSSLWPKTEWALAVQGNGLGLILRF